ncbi:MAG: hypothetical protein KDA27_01265 [Candidatus Eisenbacteria bacterium]|uniref:Uncharacterized protein n=1 Tax=Eiseniibacteriota bacterium TaxID=2212470 RepID=A0A956SBF6_UNCEI|nr:hypothetical protein [Candidatus Eisenbacteria bacterium]MCB9466243.1 hypothetical protein [Candidatus Eisenbacteria bacterium]
MMLRDVLSTVLTRAVAELLEVVLQGCIAPFYASMHRRDERLAMFASRRDLDRTVGAIDNHRMLVVILLALAVQFIARDTAVAGASLVLGVQDRRLDIDLESSLDGESVLSQSVDNSQTSLRATYTWDIGESFTVVATGGGASSYLGLNDTRLNGATDLRVRALYQPNDRLVVGAGTVVPMGLYELSANEVVAAQWVWNPRSGFPLSRFGEGWGWELTSAYSIPITPNVSGGLAAAYLRHAEFDLLGEDTGLYRLGDELSLSGAIDWRLGSSRSLLLHGALRRFGSDELSGAEFVQKGVQISGGGTAYVPFGAYFLRCGAKASYQGDNTFTRADGDTLAISEAAGSRIGLDMRIGRGTSDRVFVYLDGLVSFVTGTDYDIPVNGTVFSVGPGFGWRIGKPFSLGARFLWLTSSSDPVIRQTADGEQETSLDYTGTDVLVTLEFRP